MLNGRGDDVLVRLPEPEIEASHMRPSPSYDLLATTRPERKEYRDPYFRNIVIGQREHLMMGEYPNFFFFFFIPQARRF